ncbi:MAG TPA: BLUF domain-containing protein [Caldimonas sp.]|nr:BLUF domain-containing protein [Caldimonas sp.]
MPTSLIQILYVSRVADGLDHRAIRAILDVSRRRNRMLDVTGCLTCSGRHFAQVIEGRPDAVHPLVERIFADPRHDGVRRVLERTIATRQYPLWSMAYLYDDALDATLGLHVEREVDPAAALRTLRRIKPDTVMGAL